MRLTISLFFASIIISIASCERDNFSTNPSLKLEFSTDTMLFDTVFTTIGSATRRFKVYNRNRNDVTITSVKLAKGSQSYFRMNVDGQPTTDARDISLRSGDSLFIFVEVNVDPTNQNSPLFISDSIVFETNRNIQDVKLIAWGQDVVLYKADSLLTNTVFTNHKPYLIYSYLWVYPGVELKINAGAKLYFHNNAWLYVDGKLTVNGLPENPVVFEGDRLEAFYKDKPGQWGGIWLTTNSVNNHINWTVIKNAIAGINIFPYANQSSRTLEINNSIIKNMSYMAIDARGAWIDAGNCLFANSKEMCLSLAGGIYRFNHCTIANYWGQYVNRTGPALLLANYFVYKLGSDEIQLVEYGMDETYFRNSIIYGSRDKEIEMVSSYYEQQINAPFNYLFENAIIRVDAATNLTDENRFKNILTENPKFIKPFESNFELDTLSPAKDFGLINSALLFPIDLNNVSRISDLGPDLGAYERVELR